MSAAAAVQRLAAHKRAAAELPYGVICLREHGWIRAGDEQRLGAVFQRDLKTVDRDVSEVFCSMRDRCLGRKLCHERSPFLYEPLPPGAAFVCLAIRKLARKRKGASGPVHRLKTIQTC